MSDDVVKAFAELAGPNDLVVGTSRQRILVIIRADGEVLFGPGYTPDEAARLFWSAMGKARKENEMQGLLTQHMEGILVRLGNQDMHTEDLRLRAASETDPDKRSELLAASEVSMANLNLIAHQAIELGRALARRAKSVPAIPTRLPDQDEESAYEGLDAVPSGIDKKDLN
jgi:hypothetical protein